MSKMTSEEDGYTTPDSPPTSLSSISSLSDSARVYGKSPKYYSTHKCAEVRPAVPPALLTAAQNNDATVYAIFGGQGVACPIQELQELYAENTVLVSEFVERACAHLQGLLLKNPRFAVHYPAGLDLLSWILHPEHQPPQNELSRAPISVLIIGLLQLASYQVLVQQLGLDPGQMATFFRGIGGHSQGVVPAVMVSAAQDWESLNHLSLVALTVLFFIGCHAQSCFDPPPVGVDVLQDCEANGEGAPSCMLRVHNLDLDSLTRVVDKINHHLPDSERVELALINGSRNFVLGGPPAALYGVSRFLRRIKAAPGVSQARIPFSQRKPEVTTSYLPISVPFHTSHLSTACTLALHDLREAYVARKDLNISVYDTGNGSDLKDEQPRDIIPDVVRMIMTRRLDWAVTATFPGATHLVDLGPGKGQDGVGALTDKLKLGRGLRTIIFASRSPSSLPELGNREELLRSSSVAFGRDWWKEYGPRLIVSTSGPVIQTKMTRLLGLPPIMVAGMTPTTSCSEYVAATMRAGYHIELATGGLHDTASMETAIRAVVENSPPGRGVTCNVIYANPRALKWQFEVIRRLQREHLPIEGLTIGAGVPSPEVVSSYIHDMPGLNHISFKPGSVQGIREVIAIAKLHRDFPVILQWTGGRAGGHHSFEDFHEPILASYHRIRSCANIVLVAGSGFGDAQDSYPYLTGEWSSRLGYAPMPFDGILLGSRVMVAREARTSDEAKRLIVDIPGVSDHEWEGTYCHPTGGIATVISEMGEPIHMVNTRAVQLWSEMDATVFAIQDKAQRLGKISNDKKRIINRLNRDFAKVWFGKTCPGTVVDLDEMTYAQVAARLIDLTYLQKRERWIHSSYLALVLEFLRHLESRCIASRPQATRVIRSCEDVDTKPYDALHRLQTTYPQLSEQLISCQDAAIFTAMCQKRGRKPVPFITALDDEFEYYFKKDSLWQSEDIEAVPDEDVQRTCILHGPVAAKYSTSSDQSVQEILSDIHRGYIDRLEQHGPAVVDTDVDSTERPYTGSTRPHQFQIEEHFLNDPQVWYQGLVAGRSAQFRAAICSPTVMRERQVLDNPVRAIVKPRKGIWITVEEHPGQLEILSLYEEQKSRAGRKVVELRVSPDALIDLEIINHETASGQPVSLTQQFGPGNTLHPLQSLTSSLNEQVKELYQRVWFGDEPMLSQGVDICSIFDGGKLTVTASSVRHFTASLPNSGLARRGNTPMIAPLDYAVVVAWKALVKPLFLLDANLLRLVHLQNAFEWVPAMDQIREGDVLSTGSHVSMIVVQESGTVVEVKATIRRSGQPVVHITSQFMLRDTTNLGPNITPFRYVDDEPSKVTLDTAAAVAVLESKQWFQRRGPAIGLRGKTLHFRPRSRYSYGPKGDITQVEVTGSVLSEPGCRGTLTEIGAIHWKSATPRNIVTGYLSRHAQPSTARVLFDSPLELALDADTFSSPTDHAPYAYGSGDFNPIHLSKAMAAYAGLPDTITHGMHTSAKVRALLTRYMCGGNESLFHRFSVSFTGMVVGDQPLQLAVQHIGMVEGARIVQFAVRNHVGHPVIKGEAELRNSPTAMLFTGQGSQQKGMGMELRQSSAVTRQLWDRADTYFGNTYGEKQQHEMPGSRE